MEIYNRKSQKNKILKFGKKIKKKWNFNRISVEKIGKIRKKRPKISKILEKRGKSHRKMGNLIEKKYGIW